MIRGIRATLVVAVAVVLGTTGCSARHAAAPATPGRAPSAWEQVAAQTGTDGTVDVATALSAFALAIGPVPGATVPAGPKGPIPSGTVAVAWVMSHWADLTAAQRGAVLSDLGVPAPKASPAGYVPRAPRPAAPANPSPNLPCLTADSAGAQRYRAQLAGIEADVASNLGHAFPFPDTVFLSVNTQNIEQPSLMYTWWCSGTRVSDAITGCTIHVNPKADNGGFSDAELHSFLVHEVTHCYLFGRFGIAYDRLPSWYVEGVPTWVMSQLGGGSARLTGIWQDYLNTSYWPLYQRTYSGLGFLAHLAETGTDVWKAIDAMGTAMVPLAGNGPIAATGAGWSAAAPSADFLDSWGSGFVEGRYPGRAWTSSGPNLPEYQPPLYGTLGTEHHTTTKAAPGPLRNGGTVTFTAPGYAADVEQLDIGADVVTLAPGDGSTGRISLGGSRDAPLGGGPFCTMATCACPAGTPGEGTTFVAMAGGSHYLGLTGGPKPGTVTLAGQSLTDFCAKPARSCLVGQWTATGYTASGTFTENGGAGVRMHIDPQGKLTTLFDGMAPIAFVASISGEQVAGHFVFTGADSAVLTLPPPSMTSGTHIDVRNVDLSGLNAAVQITSPISYAMTINAGSFGSASGAGGAVGGAPTVANGWSCTGTDTMTATATFSAASLGTTSATWTFRRTGPG